MSLPPADHCRPSRVSVPQDSFVGFPTGPWQSASTLPCSADCLLDVPQCGPMGSRASSNGCCWVPTLRLIIHSYIKFWFWFGHFSLNVQMHSSFVQENVLCIAGASFPLVSKGVALWHVPAPWLTSCWWLSHLSSPSIRPPLHCQSDANASGPVGPHGGSARISLKALSTTVLD